MADQQTDRKKVNLYIDGAASGDAGAWACVLEFGGHQKEMHGHMAGTNDARMEIFAVISGLGALKMPCEVSLYTKSMPLHRAFTARGLSIWPTTGWRHKDGSSVAEKDLWQILMLQSRKHIVTVHYLKDFTDQPLNKRCSELIGESLGEYTRINTMPDESEVWHDDIPDEQDDLDEPESRA